MTGTGDYEHRVDGVTDWNGERPGVFNGAWVMGLDTEYEVDSGATNGMNRILSYQYCLTDLETRYTGVILMCGGGVGRLTLPELLGEVFFGSGIKPQSFRGRLLYVYAHNTVAEWAALRDRDEYWDQLRCIRGSLCTAPLPLRLRVRDRHRHSHPLQVHLRDSMLLAPEKARSLGDLSQVTPTKKLALPDGVIERMGDYLHQQPDEFIRYGVADAVIPVEYVTSLFAKVEELYGLKERVRVSLGAIAEHAFTAHLAQNQLSPTAVFGKEQVETRNSRGHRRRKVHDTALRHHTAPLVADAYHGGLNIAFEHRTRELEPGWCALDVDFASAYPAALSVLPAIDWEPPSDASPLLPILPGAAMTDGGETPFVFAHVRFSFPEDCHHPCLPIHTENGIVFPLSGKTTCPYPEIALARELGARIDVLREEYLPVDAGRLPFAGFMERCAEERRRHPAGSLENRAAKEIMNSIYGKIAQGIREKRRLTESENGVPEESGITCPPYAALATSVVRAALSGLIVHATKHGMEVLSATTDGAVLWVNRPAAECRGKTVAELFPEFYRDLCASPFIQPLTQGCRLLGRTEFLEVKHVGETATTWKTRMNYIGDAEGREVSSARGSLRVESSALFRFHAEPGIPTYERRLLPNPEEIASGVAADYVAYTRTEKVNTDYDFKRELRPDGSTRPWPQMAAFKRAREQADALRKGGQRATAENVALRLAGVRRRGTNPETVRRQILRAVVREGNAWHVSEMSYREIAGRLGVTEQHLKNARRLPFRAHSLPDAPVTRTTAETCAAALELSLTYEMLAVLLHTSG